MMTKSLLLPKPFLFMLINIPQTLKEFTKNAAKAMSAEQVK